MKFAKQLITYCVLGVWFIYKIMLFYFSIGFRIESASEYINYLFNAIVTLFAFSSLEKHTYTHWGKSFLATITSLAFVLSIAAENYFFQSLRYILLGWHDWDFSFFAGKGFEHYILTGEPGYHWAFLIMLALCILLIILHAQKSNIIFPVKKWLVEKAKSTRKSIYFDLTLRALLPHIAILDYMELRDIYLNEEIKCSLFHNEITVEEFDDIEALLDFKFKKMTRTYNSIFEDVSIEENETSNDNDNSDENE